MKKLFLILSIFLNAQLLGMEKASYVSAILHHPASYAFAGFALGTCAGVVGHAWYSKQESKVYIALQSEVTSEIEEEQDSCVLTVSQRNQFQAQQKILLTRCKYRAFKYFLQEGRSIENESAFRKALEESGLKDDDTLLEHYEGLKQIDSARKVIQAFNDAQLELCVQVGHYLQSKAKPQRRTAQSLSNALEEAQKVLKNIS